MWDTEKAKKLIERARETDDILTHRLADYLGYALGTITLYERLLREMDEKTTKKAKK